MSPYTPALSSSTTTVLVQSQVRTLKLKPHAAHQKLETLCQEMFASNLFSVWAKDLEEWERQFYQLKLNAEEGQDTASLELVFLIYDVIQPLLLKEQNEANQKRLFDFQDQAKTILALTVPKGKTIKNYTKEWKESSQDLILLITNLEKIELFFQDLMQKLSLLTNKDNQEIKRWFEALKHSFAHLNAIRQEMAETAHQRLDEVQPKIALLIQSFRENVALMQSLGEQMHIEEQNFLQILNQCEALLQEVQK